LRLILVRHPQTIWHAEGRYVGKADIPLDDTGIRQAELVVSRLADVKLDAVYSSPLSRCLLLANMVGEAHALDVTTDERLQEMDLGKWSGQKHDAVAEQDGETLRRWLEEPATVMLPGGESLLDVRERSTRPTCRLLTVFVAIKTAGQAHHMWSTRTCWTP